MNKKLALSFLLLLVSCANVVGWDNQNNYTYSYQNQVHTIYLPFADRQNENTQNQFFQNMLTAAKWQMALAHEYYQLSLVQEQRQINLDRQYRQSHGVSQSFLYGKDGLYAHNYDCILSWVLTQPDLNQWQACAILNEFLDNVPSISSHDKSAARAELEKKFDYQRAHPEIPAHLVAQNIENSVVARHVQEFGVTYDALWLKPNGLYYQWSSDVIDWIVYNSKLSRSQAQALWQGYCDDKRSWLARAFFKKHGINAIDQEFDKREKQEIKRQKVASQQKVEDQKAAKQKAQQQQATQPLAQSVTATPTSPIESLPTQVTQPVKTIEQPPAQALPQDFELQPAFENPVLHDDALCDHDFDNIDFATPSRDMIAGRYVLPELDFGPKELHKLLHEAQQEALAQTVASDFACIDQSYDLDAQTLGYLQHQKIDYNEYLSCCGTVLQQTLHQQTCELMTVLAQHQSTLAYAGDAIRFTDAACEQNKKEHITLACALLDGAWLFAAIPIGFAESAIGVVTLPYHLVVHREAIINGLGQAICFIIKTQLVVQDCFENLGQNGTFDAAVLHYTTILKGAWFCTKLVGNSIAQASWYDRIKGVSRFGFDFVIPGRITGALGHFFSGATALRTLEGCESLLGQEELFANIAREIIEDGAIQVSNNVPNQVLQATLQAATPAAAANSAAKAASAASNPTMSTPATSLALPAPKPVTLPTIPTSSSAPIAAGNGIIPAGALAPSSFFSWKDVGAYIAHYKNKIPSSLTYVIDSVEHHVMTRIASMRVLIPQSVQQSCVAMQKQLGTATVNITADLEHVINYGFKKNIGNLITKFRFDGGHLAGSIQKLKRLGLVTIKKEIPLGHGCIYYEAEDIFGNLLIKTEFPKHWDVETVAKKIWEAFDRPSQLDLLGKGCIERVGQTIEGVSIKIVLKKIGADYKLITAYPI